MPKTIPFEVLRNTPYKRWYQFGLRSPVILYKRLRNKYRPILRARTFVQRGRRGWGDADSWSFDFYLARVIRDGITAIRERSLSYPSQEGMTPEKWDIILGEIAAGMDASLVYADTGEWSEGGEEQFHVAMGHLHDWWFDLWD